MVRAAQDSSVSAPLELPLPTTLEQADAIASRLARRKHAWARVRVAERITYLQRCIEGVLAAAPLWAEAACRAKGIDPTAMLAGEEWFLGPVAVVAGLYELKRTLEADGQPRPRRWRDRADQSIAQVFPQDWMEQLLWLGFRGEVWLEPGQPPTQGHIYRQAVTEGQVALVLGAGNVSAIAPLDALYKLFAENQVVLLKLNPLTSPIGPLLEQAFQPLRAAGFFDLAYGGADLGQYLCEHPQVDTIHITGSQQTHDQIVWGNTPTREQPPADPKPITSELGCVTPILVVPGQWSPTDLAYQARHVAGMMTHNAGFNCASAQVLVLAQGWPQRQAFLDCLRQELAQLPPRLAYYPGAESRYQALLQQYPQAEVLGSAVGTQIPWTLIPDVPAQPDEVALTQEAFCGVLAEVSLDATEADQFLAQAVPFAHEHVWGNLSCTLLAHPTTQFRYRAEVETAIAQLRYGAIGLNVWSGVMFCLPMLTWGAFPGNSLADIRSGRGVVHNSYLFDHPQKSVLRAPFRIRPTPMWFPRHQNLRSLAQHYLAYQANPSLNQLITVVLAAFKG